MKKQSLLVVLSLFVGLAALWAHEGEHKEGKATEGMAQEQGAKEKVVYVCPMHPDVCQDKPGDCPICGMTLEAQSAESEAPEEKSATKEAGHHEEGGGHHHAGAEKHHG